MVYIIFATLQYQRANLHKTAEIINDYCKNNVKEYSEMPLRSMARQ